MFFLLFDVFVLFHVFFETKVCSLMFFFRFFVFLIFLGKKQLLFDFVCYSCSMFCYDGFKVFVIIVFVFNVYVCIFIFYLILYVLLFLILVIFALAPFSLIIAHDFGLSFRWGGWG